MYLPSPEYPLMLKTVPEPAVMIATPDFRAHDWHDTFFLHVRRGDYLHPLNRHHCVDLMEYYRHCLKAFGDATCFVVSDDMEWCMESLPELLQKRIWCSPDMSDAETLHWMSKCQRGGICANSSFSWWAAYFIHRSNSACRIFMPTPWGYPPLAPVYDLYPSWAEVVPADEKN
jgi:hypothetical protein